MWRPGARTALGPTSGVASGSISALMQGMGNHHHAIATTSPEAQRYFDQGFDLVFGFNHEEAVRSFKRSVELDPKAAMPHWGIAWALGPNYNLDVDDDRAKQANTAIAQALTLSAPHRLRHRIGRASASLPGHGRWLTS